MSRVTDFLTNGTRSIYADRAAAGRALARALAADQHLDDARDGVVLGLARGGVPVAAEVADALGAQLDVEVVRKLGVPGQQELAFGAIAEHLMVLNDSLIRSRAITEAALTAVVIRERRELARRATAYRRGRARLDLAGRTVILVDDGVATGASMHVAVLDVRRAGAAKVIIAVPTAAASARAELAAIVDGFVCPHNPKDFVAVGMSYSDFTQVEDRQVRALLDRQD
jgi:putative phosphoribosyl transferase